jgi:hypothetical protein
MVVDCARMTSGWQAGGTEVARPEPEPWYHLSAVMVGGFEVAMGGGIWVTTRAAANRTRVELPIFLCSRKR